jgi:hypothetical protein
MKCYRLKKPVKVLARPLHDLAFFIPMILALFLAGDDTFANFFKTGGENDKINIMDGDFTYYNLF